MFEFSTLARLLLDPVVLGVLALLGVVLFFYAFYLANLERERANKPALTFRAFLGAIVSRVIGFWDEWAPVLRTRTGAHATISQALGTLGIVIASADLDALVTFALMAALVYCWLRTLHGRKNVTQLFAPLDTGLVPPGAAMELAGGAQPADDEPNLAQGFAAYQRARAENRAATAQKAPKPRPKAGRRKPAARATAKRPAKKAKSKRTTKRARR